MKKLALLAFLFLVPFALHAAALININTADAAALDSLPGIGASKAAAIIQYREDHGAFAAIADIQKVSGIGPSTYANIKDLITIEGGESSVPATTAPSTTTSSSSNSSSSSSSSSTSTTKPKDEPAVLVDVGGDRTVIAGADTTYTATVSLNGAAAPTAEVHWTFGDGSKATGASVLKSYQLPGTYIVGASAVAGLGSGLGEITIMVKEAEVLIPSVAMSGITVKNGDATDALDLSYWQLTAGDAVFTIPLGTKIAAGGSVVFTPDVTGLTGTSDISLRYPSGKVAATYAGAQPIAVQPSSYQVQTVGSVSGTISSSKPTITPAHDTQTVRAPAAPAEAAAVGAALPIAASSSPKKGKGLVGILASPWALGLIGLLVFSGAALIVL